MSAEKANDSGLNKLQLYLSQMEKSISESCKRSATSQYEEIQLLILEIQVQLRSIQEDIQNLGTTKAKTTRAKKVKAEPVAGDAEDEPATPVAGDAEDEPATPTSETKPATKLKAPAAGEKMPLNSMHFFKHMVKTNEEFRAEFTTEAIQAAIDKDKVIAGKKGEQKLIAIATLMWKHIGEKTPGIKDVVKKRFEEYKAAAAKATEAEE